jgi:mono/diheme cytochrome c family protein
VLTDDTSQLAVAFPLDCQEDLSMRLGYCLRLCWRVAPFLLLALVAGRMGRYISAEAAHPTKAVDRGRYLVEAVTICFECHSERDFSKPGWPIPPGRAGGGRILWGEGTGEQVVAPNISPDLATGIGKWTNEEIARAIRKGVGRDGHILNPEMPSRYFRRLNDDDLQSIILYLRSIPPVRNRLPKMTPYVPGTKRPTVAMESVHLTHVSPQVTRGEYLVRLGGCETCHTPTDSDGYIKGLEFAGGTMFTQGDQSAASSNLTPDGTGIERYNEEQFLELMRTGRVGQRRLYSGMPWFFYRNMSTGDLKAIFAYLHALPPVRR